MTQYYNFEWRDNQSAPYEFSPVIDGEVYFCEVGYSSGSGAFVLTVKSSFQEVVCIQNLVSSCDCGDIPLAPQLGFTDNFVFRGSSRCFEVGGVFRECPDFEQPITPVYYPPDYAIVPDTSTINETDNNVVTFTVTTPHVFDGTVLYWTILDITTEGAADLTPINGSVVITNNTADFIVSAIDDVLTEGSESFRCQLRTNSITGTVVATSNIVTIEDTSLAPTYAIAPDTSTINETDSNDVTLTVTTTSVPDGTILYYTVLDITTEGASDLTPINGSVVIVGNTGEFAISAITDYLTEGSEGFQFQLRTGSIAGAIVATSILITIVDSSTAISYEITAPPTVNEGANLAATVNTTGIPDNTTLFWTVLNGTTSNADFTAVSGSVVIASNTSTFNIGIVADVTTEGSENFTIQLRTGSISGSVVATSDIVTINDTSTLTYTLTPSSLVPSECNTVTVAIATTGVPNNTTLYWTILHDTTNNSDFSSVSGSAVITTNSGSFTVFVVPDFLTEGSETFQVQLRTTSISGDVVATSPVITITDTSLNPALGDTRFTNRNGDNVAFNDTSLDYAWSVFLAYYPDGVTLQSACGVNKDGVVTAAGQITFYGSATNGTVLSNKGYWQANSSTCPPI